MTMTAVLDQSSITEFIESSESTNAACNRRIAQTYVAGKTGALASVALAVRPTTSVAQVLRVSVHVVENGEIASTALGAATLDTTTTAVSQPIVFTSLIPQVTGKVYAIVADYPGGSSTKSFAWSASKSNTAPGRQCLVSTSRGWTAQPAEVVCDFQTYVTESAVNVDEDVVALGGAQAMGRSPVQTFPGTGGD
jgi:hypothetical protein